MHYEGESKLKFKAEDFENHFNVLMQNVVPLNADQVKIQSDVQERASHLSKTKHEGNGRDYKCKITKDDVLRAIKNLKKGTSPGIDGVTPEHIIYAVSPEHADILAHTYSIMISFAIIPDIFQNSLISHYLKSLH